MKKFLLRDRVIFEVKGKKHIGRVTGLLKQKRRVVSDTGERALVSQNDLKHAQDRVLILEARLDRSLRSRRTYGPMMQQLLSAYGADVMYERVHTLEDFRLFLRQEGPKINTRFIHYIGHGQCPEKKKAVLRLTFEDIDLQEDLDVFKGLGGKVLIFSCCEVGSNVRVMEQIKVASGAAAVIAYRTEVMDTYTNLAEAMLYDRLFAGLRPSAAVNAVTDALRTLGARAEGARKPVLVCV